MRAMDTKELLNGGKSDIYDLILYDNEEDYDFDILFTPDEEIPDNVVPVEVFMTKQILKMLGDSDVR